MNCFKWCITNKKMLITMDGKSISDLYLLRLSAILLHAVADIGFIRFLDSPIQVDRMKLPRGRGSFRLQKSNMYIMKYFFSFRVQEKKS